MTRPTPSKVRRHARATRQALALCEAEQLRRVDAITAGAALRAAGLPPLLAAALRNRIRLLPEPKENHR